MGMSANNDLRGAGFDQFLSFIFREKVEGEYSKFWHWETDVIFEPAEIVSHYMRLFAEPQVLIKKFSKAVLEHGFWAIQSGNLDCDVSHIIWMEELPFGIRANCVRSMFYLFERLFAMEPLDTAPNLWWDSLCYDWHCGNRSRENGGEDAEMQDVMFETLAKILQLPSFYCQRDALHGLGHLHHPDTGELVQSYIARNPGLDPEIKDYALAAAKFSVM
jgi:hypothetical protein